MAFKRLFPAQEESEKVFLLIRRHWFSYVIFWFLGLLMSAPAIGVIIFWVYNPDLSPYVGNIIILGESVYVLIILALLLYGFIDYYLDVYIVTDRRIVDIKQNGFFHREISELYLEEVQDVKAKIDGFFPTTLHYGQVIIQTAGETENFIFDAVPHPYAISKRIIDLHEGVKNKTKETEFQGHQDDEEALEVRGYSVNMNPTDVKVNAALKRPGIKEVMNKYESSLIAEQPVVDNVILSRTISKEGFLEEGKQINIE